MLNRYEEKIKTPKLYTHFAQTTDTKLIQTDFSISTRSQGQFSSLGPHAPSLWGPPLPFPSLFSPPLLIPFVPPFLSPHGERLRA
jgi:hypothetical protein